MEELRRFLTNVINDLDSGRLSNEEVMKISELMLWWNTRRAVVEGENISENEAMKFFSLGWHVYKNILRE